MSNKKSEGWKTISAPIPFASAYLKVPHGWLVAYTEIGYDTAVVHVLDRSVEWDVEKWQLIKAPVHYSSARLKVPGGWLVAYTENGYGTALVFAADAKHEWVAD